MIEVALWSKKRIVFWLACIEEVCGYQVTMAQCNMEWVDQIRFFILEASRTPFVLLSGFGESKIACLRISSSIFFDETNQLVFHV